MIYLIGGPPRVGKTLLAAELIRRRPMHAISTDAIRYMLRRFLLKDQVPPELLSEWDAITREEPVTILERQNQESHALWPALKLIVDSYNEDGVDLLIEGVAVLPELVSQLSCSYRCVILGNSSNRHVSLVHQEARANPNDWLYTYTDEQIDHYCRFFQHMSKFLRIEAERYNQPFFEIADNSFLSDLRQAVQALAR